LLIYNIKNGFVDSYWFTSHYSTLTKSFGEKNKRLLSLFDSKAQVPLVLHEISAGCHSWMDLYTALGRNRKLFIGRALDPLTCEVAIPALTWMDAQNQEPICLYLNIPGGSLEAAFSIYDTMKYLQSPIKTVNIALTSGVGCLIASGGTYGMRFAYPSSKFFLGKCGVDYPLKGSPKDVASRVQRIQSLNVRLMEEIAMCCNKSFSTIDRDFKKDFYLSPSDAVRYGLIDSVLNAPKVTDIQCSFFRFLIIFSTTRTNETRYWSLVN
jgi:ATP-dependent Clp protease protease subunit